MQYRDIILLNSVSLADSSQQDRISHKMIKAGFSRVGQTRPGQAKTNNGNISQAQKSTAVINYMVASSFLKHVQTRPRWRHSHMQGVIHDDRV